MSREQLSGGGWRAARGAEGGAPVDGSDGSRRSRSRRRGAAGGPVTVWGEARPAAGAVLPPGSWEGRSPQQPACRRTAVGETLARPLMEGC